MLILLLLALGAAAVIGSQAGASAGTTPPKGGGGGGAGTGLPPTVPPPLCPQLDQLPSQIRAGVEELLRSSNAPGLAQAAVVARSYGLEELAKCLEAQAAISVPSPGPDTGLPSPSIPIPGPGSNDINIEDFCPEASMLPPDILAQLNVLLDQGPSQAPAVRQIATTLQWTLPQVAACLNVLADKMDSGEL